MAKRRSSVSCKRATVVLLCCGSLSLAFLAPAAAAPSEEAQAASASPPPPPPSSPAAKQAEPAKKPPDLPPGVKQVDHDPKLFRPDPSYQDKPYDPVAQEQIYGGKHLNKTARPWVEAGRHQYEPGSYDPAYTWFGDLNLATPAAMAFGDLRTPPPSNATALPHAQAPTPQPPLAPP